MNQELLANTAREDSVYVYIFVLISYHIHSISNSN